MLPVCVVGLGLIGGSVLRAAAAAGRRVVGVTESVDDAEAAIADGFPVRSTVDDALADAGADAVVVLAVPLPAVDTVLRAVAAHAPRCTLTDVVSVKQPVVDAVAALAPHARYAGGHPMAGGSRSGWAAGSATLFGGASWAVTIQDDTELATWRTVAELALDCGARVVPTTAAEHDDAVARISHLPHVLAAVLASVGADGGPLALSLAAGSFRDGTRVAASRPELVLAMCEGNRLPLLAAVDDALGRLGAARGALASTGALRATVHSGHQARDALDRLQATARQTVTVDLVRQDAATRLRAIGAAGGRIVRFDGDTAAVELPSPHTTA